MTSSLFITWIEAFTNYLLRERKASEHTQKAYKRDLVQFADYWQESQKQSGQPGDAQKIVEKFLAHLSHKQVTASSIARKISCLNSYKKFLKKQGLLMPIELKRPHLELKAPITLPIKDIFNLLDLVGIGDIPTQFPHRDKALLELIYSTGITCSEVVKIEINCFDFQARSIIIRNKRKKERIVLFGGQAAVCIKAYLDNERLPIKSTQEALFLNHRHKPITPRTVQRICALFRTVLEKKRMITPQVLRSSCAAHLIKNGADIEVVQELLGHKTRVSTERYKKVRI